MFKAVVQNKQNFNLKIFDNNKLFVIIRVAMEKQGAFALCSGSNRYYLSRYSEQNHRTKQPKGIQKQASEFRRFTMTNKQTGEEAVSPIKRAILAGFALIFFISVTAFAVPPVVYEVTISDGKTLTTVSTARTDAEAILKEAGIVLTEDRGDSVINTFFSEEDGKAFIEYKRGSKITVKNYDGSKKTVYCSGTVEEAVKKAGYTIPEGHKTNISLQELVNDETVIEIYKTYTVKVKTGKKTKKCTVSGKNVGEALKNAGYELGELDYTSPKASAPLKNGMTVTIHKVTVKQRVQVKNIAFKTVYQNTDELYRGQSQVVVNGVEGEKVIGFDDYYTDGKLTKSVKISETVTKEPVDKVIYQGTKEHVYPACAPVGTPISELPLPSYVQIGSNGLPLNYKSVRGAKATAYCEPGGTTSTGRPAMAGYIAVDPDEIPYGTEMYIVSADGRYVYGYCIAADTGGFIYDVDNTVDLYLNSETQCVNWGRRDIIIYFL